MAVTARRSPQRKVSEMSIDSRETSTAKASTPGLDLRNAIPRITLDRLVPPELLDAEPATVLRARLLVLYSIVVLTAPTLFALIYLYDQMPDVAATMGAAAILGALTTPVMWWSRSMVVAGNYAALTFAAANSIALLQMSGQDAGSFYWLGATPVFAAFLAGPRWGVLWLGISSAVATTIAWLSSRGILGQENHLPSPFNDLMGVLTLSALMLTLALIYERAKDRTLGQLVQAARELDAARAKAEAATRARTAFVAHMSHEIRTPMNGVLGMADLLLGRELSVQARSDAQVILDSSRALVEIIDDILDFAKADAGHLTLQPRPTDLRELLRSAVTLLSERARTAQLRVTVQVDPSVPPWLQVDSGRFRQILLNLLGNAIKFTPTGSIDVRAQWTADRLQVQVADTGIGISQAEITRLFQPFQQLDGTTTRQYGGTGLGLVICRQLVQAMGGEISVQSGVGHGSIFSFDIEAKQAALSPPMAPGSVTPVGRAPAVLRVLVVEDNAVNRLVARRMLERLGHQVSEAEGGEQALEMTARCQFDLVLMDCQMPGMDGFSATRALRLRPGTDGQVTVIALTASAQAEDRQRCLDAGMNGFLAKPLDPAALAYAIATLGKS